MPIFEYQCRKCGKISELLVRSVSARVKAKCEHCGSEDVEKRFSSFSVAQGQPSAPSCASGACDMGASGGCSGGSCPFGG